MPLNPEQEEGLQSALRLTRILAFALCYASIAIYVALYALQVLQGRWTAFFQGFQVVPWRSPLVLALVVVSAGTIALAYALPGILLGVLQRSQPILKALHSCSLAVFALLESVAIYGLVLGFVAGPAVASLSLLLLLVPPLLCPLMMPSEAKWRDAFEQSLLRQGSENV
jgi:hypothetical protein